MTMIDLRSEKTEYLTNDEVFNFFVPSSEIDTITKIKNTYLVGHKGSGKSFLMKYLSLPLQLKRLSSGNTLEYDLKSIGILIQCNVGRFGTLREWPNMVISEDWIKNFTHAFNLSATEVFLNSLQQLIHERKNISDNELSEFLNSIVKLLRIEVGDTNLKNVLNVIDDELNLIQEEFQQNNNLNSDRFYTGFSFLYELRTKFQKFFSNYTEIEPVFLLDEYNELSNAQQKVINELIHIRQPVFKMCCLPQSYLKDRVHGGQNDIDHDYDVVDLANTPLTPNSSELSMISKFMKDVGNKRLEKYSSKIETLLEEPQSFVLSEGKRTKADIRKINEAKYCGFKNFVILSSGNPKTFLDLIQNTIKKAIGRGVDFTNPIPASIQLDSILEYSIKRRKEVVLSDTQNGRALFRLVEFVGKYLQYKTMSTGNDYRFFSIINPDLLSDNASDTIELSLKNSVMLQNDLGRVSKSEKIRLDILTLNNYLLPSFELPLSHWQIWEVHSKTINTVLEPGGIEKITTVETTPSSKPPIKKDLNLTDYGLLAKISELIKKQELILFIGSGLSTYAGLKSASEIVNNIKKILGITHTLDFEKAVSYYTNTHGDETCVEFLKNELSHPQKLKLDLHEKLLELDIKIIVTTNYDTLIEDMENKLKKTPQVIITKDQITSYNEKNNVVFKIHGDFNHSEYLVATEEQYDKYAHSHEFMITRLKSLLQNKSVLFLGYSLNDRNFNNIRHLVGSELGNLKESFAIFPEINEHEIDLLSKKNIRVISADFDSVVRSLVNK